MTVGDIIQIEQALGVILPAVYIEIMTEPAASEPDHYFWHRYLFNDPKKVIERTIDQRDILLSYDLAWKPSWVVVTLASDECVLMDTADPAVSLFIVDHETLITRPFEATLEQWARALD